MSIFSRAVCTLLFALALVSCGGEKELRSMDGATLVSKENPTMNFQPAEGFDYVGSFKIVLKERANAERYHWVISDNGRVRKMLIVQIEGLLDGQEGKYSFSVPPADEQSAGNYKFSPEPIELGGKAFIHNTWAYNNKASAEADPDLESASTLKLLTEKGYRLDDELIMSRFVRAVGDDSRHELILFYYEPLADHLWSLTNFPEEEGLTVEYDVFSDMIRSRSLESFTVTFED